MANAEPTPSPRGRPAPTRRGILLRNGARWLLASTFAALVCGLLWLTRSRSLPDAVPIVGYPTFHDFDYGPLFLGNRLIVWIGPGLVLAGVWALRRWGPLSEVRDPAIRAPLVDLATLTTPVERASPARLLLLAPPAAVLWLAVDSGAAESPTSAWPGIMAAVAYVVATVGLGAILGRRSGRARRASGERSGHEAATWLQATTTVNAVAAPIVAVGALTLFAHRTSTVSTSGSVEYWSWLPWWVTVALLAAATGWLIAGRRARPWDETERIGVSVAVGSVAVFMVTTTLPGPIPPLDGLDDMMSASGAEILLQGAVPWRDFLFIHGLWDDSLRSVVGFWLFEHTLWATYAIDTALWRPLCWVGVYLLGVWAAGRRLIPIVCVFVVTVWFWHTFHYFPRWIAAAPILILLGASLRRDRWTWTAALTTALFVQAVLVPESAFQVIAVVVVLVASDLHHRGADVGRWRALRRTRVFVATGAACTAALCAVLAPLGALVPFVGYYLVFGPGHAAAGALPPLEFSTSFYRAWYAAAVLLVAATLVILLGRVLARRPMTPLDWVMLAGALLGGLYSVKGVARADDGHLVHSISLVMPLAVLWLVRLSSARSSRAGLAWPRRAEGRTGPPAGLIVVVALSLVAAPTAAQALWATPRHNVVAVGDTREPLVGFTGADNPSPSLVADLELLLDTFGGEDRTVFDFTNSPGYFYYLLGGTSPTAFYHVSMAIPEFAQQMLIDDLERSRPALVAFDSSTIGGSSWDGPRNEVRHFEVSQYLLDGWTPLVRLHGVLFLLRDDLAASERDRLPDFGDAARTDDLLLAADRCDWGASAQYLPSPSEPDDTVSLTPGRPRPTQVVTLSGWTYDTAADRPIDRILVTAGDRVVAEGEVTVARPDVAEALGFDGAELSGFTLSAATTRRGDIATYVVLADGLAHPLGPATALPATLRSPSGPVPTSPEPAAGVLDQLDVSASTAYAVDIPDDVDLSDYQVLTLDAGPRPLGAGRIGIADRLSSDPGLNPWISARTLRRTGSSIDVRVGSCLQWHGFEGDRLYVTRSGGSPLTEVRLGRLLADRPSIAATPPAPSDRAAR